MVRHLWRFFIVRKREADPHLPIPEPTSASDTPPAKEPDLPVVFGYYDGIKDDFFYGWARYVDDSDRPVLIEICFDGVVIGTTLATVGRPDLRAAGVGHGRFGWRFPMPDGLAPGVVIDVIVRSAGGNPLNGGAFAFTVDRELDPDGQRQCETFVAAVLGDADARRLPAPLEPPPKVHFLLYTPVPLALEEFGASEYSYAFVRRAFEPLLRKLGQIHDARDVESVDDMLAAIEASGESAVLLSFAPPHRTLSGWRCPVVPVIAWEYPTIPVKPLDGDPRQDWRFSLRRAGRAITLSEFAASAIRATMGARFPVVSIPAPVWERFASIASRAEGDAPTTVALRGLIFDTRGRRFEPRATIPPLPDGTFDTSYPNSVEIDGVVFTSIFSPRDSRKNWGDILIAFLAAHRHNADATLVLKMVAADATWWWWEVHDILNSMPAFSCRVLVLHGYLEDENFKALISASHWIVCASNAEGLCLPLLEYMSAGKPAIAPRHTAMTEYITDDNALIVASDEEYFGYPHEPDMEYLTTRHRVAWDALVGALANGYRIVSSMPDDYTARSRAARDTMRTFCSDEIVAAKLGEFLGLNLTPPSDAASPSPLIRELAPPC
jgi:glycosyltransferase involved in cell wall biosynthesis